MIFIRVLREYCDSLRHSEKHPVSGHHARGKLQSDASKLHNQRGLEESCWPFHKAVIERLGVKLVLCLGSKARDIVKKRLGCARQPIEEQSEDNNRPWGSRVYRNAAGIVVVGVPYCSSRDAPSFPVAS